MSRLFTFLSGFLAFAGCFSFSFVHAIPVSVQIDERTTIIDLKQKYPDRFIFSGPSDEKWVALTFDDAPDPRFTDHILNILLSEGVRATFFVVGERAQNWPQAVLRMQREGHAIGNHTYNHPHLPALSDQAFYEQVEKTQMILERITREKPFLFRPPYGDITESQLRRLIEDGMTIVNWNVDSLDWKTDSAAEIYQNIFKDVRPGAIVLQHAGSGQGGDLTGTIEALPLVIRELKRKGYRFVTVPELIAAKFIDPALGMVWTDAKR